MVIFIGCSLVSASPYQGRLSEMSRRHLKSSERSKAFETVKKVVKFSFPLCTLYMQYKIKSSGQTAVFRLEWKVIVETQSRISLVNVFT